MLEPETELRLLLCTVDILAQRDSLSYDEQGLAPVSLSEELHDVLGVWRGQVQGVHHVQVVLEERRVRSSLLEERQAGLTTQLDRGAAGKLS